MARSSTSFQPGRSGNPAGRPPQRSFKTIYREKLTTERRERIAEKFIREAEAGSIAHYQAILTQLGELSEPGAPTINILQLIAGRPELRDMAQRLFAALPLGSGDAGGLGGLRETGRWLPVGDMMLERSCPGC